jgi:hypothetical protein
MEPEEVTLREVYDDGVLELEDGRRLQVNPGDISTVLLWSPTSTLNVLETGDGSFDVTVILQRTGTTIRARWQ